MNIYFSRHCKITKNVKELYLLNTVIIFHLIYDDESKDEIR
jgi:hypothetical protein